MPTKYVPELHDVMYTKINATNGGYLRWRYPMIMRPRTLIIESDKDYGDEYDFGSEKGLESDDLSLDDEEFPLGTNAEDYISMVREVVDKLSTYE
jgi:hypothetical protein